MILKIIVVMVGVLFLAILLYSPANSGTGPGTALGALSVIGVIFKSILLGIGLFLFFMLYKVFLKTRTNNKYLILVTFMDVVVIIYTSFFLFAFTDDAYRCGYGGILWDSIVHGYSFFYTFRFLIFLIIVMIIFYISNIRLIKLSKAKGTLIHLLICIAIAVGISTLFEFAPTIKLFISNKRYEVHLKEKGVRITDDCQQKLKKNLKYVE